jgi:hypothetical protein
LPSSDIIQILGHTSPQMYVDTYDRESPEHLVKITRNVIIINGDFFRKSLRLLNNNEN